MVVIKSMLFLIAVPGTVLVLAPYLLLRSGCSLFPLALGQLRWIGLAPIVTGVSMLLWSFWAFAFIGKGTPAPNDPPKRFVAVGLYRFVRNPMYVGVLLVLLGETLLFQSSALLIYSLMVFIAFNLFVVFYEEPRLRRQFGEAYLRYLRAVPRWVPRAPMPPTSDQVDDRDD